MKYITAITALAGAIVSTAMPVESGECRAYPPGNAPTPNSNTLSNFMNSTIYSDFALASKTPLGYEPVVIDSNSTVLNDDSYMTYVPIPAEVPNGHAPSYCASICNEDSTCKSFNTYYQRNPSLVPAESCPNPEAIVHSRCAMYSESLTADQVANNGQNRGPMLFEVRMRGSNVYNKLVSPSQANHTVTTTVFAMSTTVASSIKHHTVTVSAPAEVVPASTVTVTVTAL